MKLKIRKWDYWQTYRKDRGQPPWIKVHRSLMRDPNWVALTDAQRGHLIQIWMLAADSKGFIPANPALIKRLCCMESEPDLETLANHEFLEGWRHGGVTTASSRRQHDAPEAEKRREEKNRVATNGVAAHAKQPLREPSKLQIVIEAWKIQTGVDPKDADWDKAHYKRHLRPAQSLLNLFSADVDAVCDCIETVYRQLVEKKGLDLSLQGVVNNSGRFRQEWLERKAKREMGRV